MTTQTDTPGSVTAVYQVTGMSCGHCEGSVSGEISELAGVTSVKAVAATGEVTVVSEAPLDERPCAPPWTRRATSSSAGPDTRSPAPDRAVPSHTGSAATRLTGPDRPPARRTRTADPRSS